MEVERAICIPRKHIPARIVKVIAQNGKQVKRDDVLLVYEYDEKRQVPASKVHGYNSNSNTNEENNEIDNGMGNGNGMSNTGYILGEDDGDNDFPDYDFEPDYGDPFYQQKLELAKQRAANRSSVPMTTVSIKVREELRSKYEGKVKFNSNSNNNNNTYKENAVITSDKESVMFVVEPCSHPVQMKNMCQLCFKMIDQNDYSNLSNQLQTLSASSSSLSGNRSNTSNSNNTINLTYDNSGLRVTMEEAKRIEHSSTLRLLNQKRLSLIVDLDQTIVHATRDNPHTNFAAVLEERQRVVRNNMDRRSMSNSGAASSAADAAAEADDEAEAVVLGDITSFYLPRTPMKHYVKLRPGLRTFLSEASKLYDLHIYTMGARSYAEAVANFIDPKREFFKERIVSRDENGPMMLKSIKRLFPCDSSMVVIIDDREDVWNNSPNLLRVAPYSFFADDDINAPVWAKPHLVNSASRKPTNQSTASDDQEKDGDENNSGSRERRSPLMQRSRAMATFRNGRLFDDDDDLETILDILKSIHASWYGSYVPPSPTSGGPSDLDSMILPQSSRIMTELKSQVLDGTVLVFSSVVPLGMDPVRSEWGVLARGFGAKVHHNVGKSVTHIVANKPGTDKVAWAIKHNKDHPDAPVHIVTLGWLLESAMKWQRQYESRYALPPVGRYRDEDGSKDGTPDFQEAELPPDELPIEQTSFEEVDAVIGEEVDEHEAAFADIDANTNWSELAKDLADDFGSDLEYDSDEEDDDETANESDASASAAKNGTPRGQKRKARSGASSTRTRSRSSSVGSRAGDSKEEDGESRGSVKYMRGAKGTKITSPLSRELTRSDDGNSTGVTANADAGAGAATGIQAVAEGDGTVSRSDEWDANELEALERELEAELAGI